jgi:glycopeptide antibiotics resistance protein
MPGVILFSGREWAVSLALLGIVVLILRRRSRPWRFLLILSGFWLYLTLLISLAFFPMPAESLPWRRNLRHLMRELRWFPFSYLFDPRTTPRLILAEILGNIAATVPFGFYLPLLWPRARRHMGRWIWLPGLCIESGQFLLGLLHAPYRTIDITDVLLNALGVAVGYGILWTINRPRTADGRPLQDDGRWG